MNDGATPYHHDLPITRGDGRRQDVEIEPGAAPRSASIMPLIVLYQQAWELAHSAEPSLSRFERAAEAVALSEAVVHLLAEAGDEEGHQRWSVRLSEARHWCAVVRDALAEQEEQAS